MRPQKRGRDSICKLSLFYFFREPNFAEWKALVEGIDKHDPAMTMVKVMTLVFGDRYLACVLMASDHPYVVVTAGNLPTAHIKNWFRRGSDQMTSRPGWTLANETLAVLMRRADCVVRIKVLQLGEDLIQQL